MKPHFQLYCPSSVFLNLIFMRFILQGGARTVTSVFSIACVVWILKNILILSFKQFSTKKILKKELIHGLSLASSLLEKFHSEQYHYLQVRYPGQVISMTFSPLKISLSAQVLYNLKKASFNPLKH